MNYQKGKIYKIESNMGDKIYIGSTTKEYLSQRMTAHRSKYNQWKKGKVTKTNSFDLFDEYGIENCEIILLELCPCNSKDELTSRESHYIRTLDCVNKHIPGRTYKEWRSENKEILSKKAKEYYEANKETISEKYRQYCKDNKESITKYKKLYYEENKESNSEKRKEYRTSNKGVMSEYQKIYREDNKEAILEYKKQIFMCDCGSECTLSHKSRHFKSKKHLDFIASKSQ